MTETVVRITTGAFTGVAGTVVGYAGRGDYVIETLPVTTPHYVPRYIRVSGESLWHESGPDVRYAPVIGPTRWVELSREANGIGRS